MTDAGQNVAPIQPIAMLVNIRQVKVKINVPEDDIAKIHIGQVFRFTVSSLPEQTFTARVTEKGVSADPITRSYKVKAVADAYACGFGCSKHHPYLYLHILRLILCFWNRVEYGNACRFDRHLRYDSG